MKNFISLLLIALSLLAEVSSAAVNNGCTVCSTLETNSSESTEGCETSLQVFKLRNEECTTLAKPQALAERYQSDESLVAVSNKTNQKFQHHRAKQYNSPIYLSNRVFMI